jgi:hypothetical protein
MKKFYLTIMAMAMFFSSVNAQTVIPAGAGVGGGEIILPQYAYFGGTVASRSPFVCRLTLTGLTPSTTYRYTTGISSTSTITTTFAAGNFIHINNTTDATYGNILGFTSQKGLNGAYLSFNNVITSGTTNYFGRFDTDASGNYTGWFATVTLGNGTQQASGSDAYFYVNIGSETSTAFSPTISYRTASTIKLLDYTTNSTGVTALVGTTSGIGNEKLVSLYDNTSFTGRPLYTTFTENDGLNLASFTTWYTTAASSNVNGVSGKWGAVIPNNLASGVRGIRFYEPSDGSQIVVGNGSGNTSTDGVWNSVSTVNPTGGDATPIVINSIAPSTLPISLSSFTASALANSVNLNWETAQEINNQYFELLRSTDGKSFSAITKVNGALNSTEIRKYSFTDYSAQSGTNYYQLKQVDTDGKFTISNTVSANMGLQDESFKVISSSDKDITIAISLNKAVKGEIVYTQLDGKVLFKQTYDLSNGYNSINVPVTLNPNQIGIVSFFDGTNLKSIKILR